MKERDISLKLKGRKYLEGGMKHSFFETNVVIGSLSHVLGFCIQTSDVIIIFEKQIQIEFGWFCGLKLASETNA
jgi:hypothetical protein